jgi:hypothetical protein
MVCEGTLSTLSFCPAKDVDCGIAIRGGETGFRKSPFYD